MPPNNMHCTSRSIITPLLQSTARSALPPPFLLPAFHQTTSFSTTQSASARKDHNPRRGISALKRSGLNKRTRLSVSLSNLPRPVLDPDQHTPIQVADDHGLWGFFNAAHDPLLTPEDLHAHGRGWSVQELRAKSWDDLHRLWWVCAKEVNRVATYEAERKRLEAGYGEYEAEERVREVRQTMKAIRHVLTERWYAWENARVAAMEDEEVDLYADPEQGQSAYLPKPEVEEDALSQQTGDIPPQTESVPVGRDARV